MCHHKVGRKHPNQEYIQIDTTNILFICGGAFVGLEKMVQDRLGTKAMGFDTTHNVRMNELSFSEVLKRPSRKIWCILA